MSNVVARSFLNDESVIKLESSEGSKNVVKKQQEIDDLKQKEIDSRVDLELLYRNASENNKELGELMSIGFFGRLFKKKEIEAKIAELQGIKRNFDTEINATIEKIELIEKISSRLKAELERYSAELAKVGLTPEDIIAEYNLIKQELIQREQLKTAKAVPSSEPQKPKSTRMSQVDRFNARFAKHIQMKGKQDSVPQEAQPE